MKTVDNYFEFAGMLILLIIYLLSKSRKNS